MNFVWLVTSFVIFGAWSASAVRNGKEEAICAPFLTSPKSSPLIPDLKRNLKYDEDAEFSCELVLQDEDLPMQIRLTIHEGLYYLAVRHIQLGLHRERTAARHAKLLAVIVPKSFRFQYAFGTWSVHQEVGDFPSAKKAFHECLYGNASRDSEATTEDRFRARQYYIRSLAALEDMEGAAREAQLQLADFPFDFEVDFLLQNYQHRFDFPAQHAPASSHVQTLQELIAVYDNVTVDFADYDHCRAFPASVLQRNETCTLSNAGDAVCTSAPPLVHDVTSFPSSEEFSEYLRERIPVKISTGSVEALSSSLRWHVHSHWFTTDTATGATVLNKDYFNAIIGDEENDVVVETAAQPRDCDDAVELKDIACVNFGLTLSSARRVVPFHTVLAQDFFDPKAQTSWYLNVQTAGSGTPPFNPPLHKFKDDLPVTNNSFFDLVRENLTDINLWMSHNRLRHRATGSRLHRDANDNLYLVLQGTKTFKLWHPCQFQAMHTVAPTFFVNKDGMTNQFNVRAFRDYVHNHMNQSTQLLQVEDQHRPLTDLLSTLISNDVPYDNTHAHFSRLSSHETASSLSLPEPAAEVTLQAGDALYLPTGWFHEVSSHPGVHSAVNLWWKPAYWEEALSSELTARESLFRYLLERLTNEE